MRFVSRNSEILRLCAGKDVLHLGCVGFADSAPEQRIAQASRSLHFALSKAARTVGLDYSREAIDYFSEHGVFDNVVFGNAERLQDVSLNRTFDVIVAGDIIEHISRPGDMLDGLRRFMRPDTLLLVTTPNAFGGASILRYALGKFREGGEHVASYNSQNLTHLLERHGYVVQGIDTCYHPHAEERGGIGFKVGKALLNAAPRFGGTLFVRAAPAAS
jgi:2-polyprenyl-3-methyl-5-hydroxy-6-metoxy-1,4-benzoquinol methylase